MSGDQIDFLSGVSVDETELEVAKEILLDAGYKVTKVLITTKFEKTKELKDFFYSRLYSKYPERLIDKVDNIKRDMRMANDFIESRMLDNTIGRMVALQECVDIINIIFDYEDEFMFKYPVVNIGILGQGKIGWITQKAVEILNRERYKEASRKSEEMLIEIENNTEIDLVEKSNKMSDMLASLEDKNG